MALGLGRTPFQKPFLKLCPQLIQELPSAMVNFSYEGFNAKAMVSEMNTVAIREKRNSIFDLFFTPVPLHLVVGVQQTA